MAEQGTWGKIKKGAEIASSLKNFWATTAGFRGVVTWAIICDVLSSIPLVGLIFSGLGYATIWLTLEIKGVNASIFGDTKRMASFASEWVAGALGLSVVPGITVWTYFCIADYKTEQTTQQRKELASMEARMKTTQRKTTQGTLQQRGGGKQTKTQKGKRRKTSTYW